MNDLIVERKTAIHLLRSGHSVTEVAQMLKRHRNWVTKWHQRYQQEGWAGLADRSRAPHKHGRKVKDRVWQDICQARSELEEEAESRTTDLNYIGALAIRTRLKKKGLDPLPSKSTIERVLREEKMSRPYQKQEETKIDYPHVQPTKALQLCQVDIVPHFLTGGERVPCFNGMDVVSRFPTGQAFSQRRSDDAAQFLIHTWQEIGIATYTQVDNEGCFSGGSTHPYVLGKVVRLALAVGTELLFSPFGHPESNGSIERFHQEYNRHVWEGIYLHDRAQVDEQAKRFFQAYRHSEHHSALGGLSPNDHHQQVPARKLDPNFILPEGKLSLYEGRVHFMRRVAADCTVRVLNVNWAVPQASPNTGVWVTLELKPARATLAIYDAAPDVSTRHCLIQHPFPLNEAVLPRPADLADILATVDLDQAPLPASDPPDDDNSISQLTLVGALIFQTIRLATRMMHTIY